MGSMGTQRSNNNSNIIGLLPILLKQLFFLLLVINNSNIFNNNGGKNILVNAEHVKYEWVIEEWVVDFMRPTKELPGIHAKRQKPFNIPESQRKAAILINGQYPGPTIDVYENDTVEIHVINKLLTESVSIHWHGVHPVDTPWEDGATYITNAAIRPGYNYTYEFRSWPAGTHYYHSHMDAVQSSKGLKGPFIVRKRDDPFKDMYDEEQIVVVSDEWRDPAICLKLEGAMPGNDVCSDLDWAGFNGQVGNGTKAYPYPLIEIEQDKCYRMRFVGMFANTENFKISIAGHSMTLISLDGHDVKPIKISDFNMHLGERYDVVLCGNQAPGYYLMNATYDYGCSLQPGNFIPPGFHPVPHCSWYAYVKYKNYDKHQFHLPMGYPPVVSYPAGAEIPFFQSFDLTNREGWFLTEPWDKEDAEPEEPDVRYVVSLGLQGPTYSKPTDRPLTKGRWYMDLEDRRQSMVMPTTPLLHTKGECGAEKTPVIEVPENMTTVEIILNNLSPAAHVVHMHGMPFKVINFANFEWCNINKTSCFLLPEVANPCPREDRAFGDPEHPGIELGLYWGCKYNEKKDKRTQNLINPLVKDTFQLWQRSWAVIRFKATHAGMWLFHCHMEQHVPLGMQMVFNIGKNRQLPIPKKVFTEGQCPIINPEVIDDKKPSSSSSSSYPSSFVNHATEKCELHERKLVEENKILRSRIELLEKQLHLD